MKMSCYHTVGLPQLYFVDANGLEVNIRLPRQVHGEILLTLASHVYHNGSDEDKAILAQIIDELRDV